ncbi:MAG: hypothetical protein EOO11_13260 [Chitinophagaceae bacterium]|nr:MAG: hypothetical protein EOO11_13260 [Chitinophagaceae bacterium]
MQADFIQANNLPYAMASRYSSHNITSLMYLESAYKAGDLKLAGKLRGAIEKDLRDQKTYYDYLRNESEDMFSSEAREDYQNTILLEKILPAIVRQYDPAARQQAPENVTPPPAPSTAPAGGQ